MAIPLLGGTAFALIQCHPNFKHIFPADVGILRTGTFGESQLAAVLPFDAGGCPDRFSYFKEVDIFFQIGMGLPEAVLLGIALADDSIDGVEVLPACRARKGEHTLPVSQFDALAGCMGLKGELFCLS